MRALTLTQPWAGLVASGIKLVENRSRAIIRPADFGEPFAIHASREIDVSVYGRIADIAPEIRAEISDIAESLWYPLSRITSAVIGVATIDKAMNGWDAKAIAVHAGALRFTSGELLGANQVRWFFGPIGYLLRDVRALATPVACRGHQGFWTLPTDIERAVAAQLEAF